MQEKCFPLPVWARRAEVLRLTGVPRDKLISWAMRGEVQFRKFGSAQQSAIVYKLADVLKKIEELEKDQINE